MVRYSQRDPEWTYSHKVPTVTSYTLEKAPRSPWKECLERDVWSHKTLSQDKAGKCMSNAGALMETLTATMATSQETVSTDTSVAIVL